jgi:cysteine desulfurase
MVTPYFWQRRRIYLDHAALTPPCPEVVALLSRWGKTVVGNPSSLHAEGRSAASRLAMARQQCAQVLSVRPSGVIFTSGGTEANALALLGYVETLVREGRSYNDMEIISTAIEHPSITMTLAQLADQGVRVVTVPVDAQGLVTPAALTHLLSARTVMVACAYVNSEVGTVQPVIALVRAIRQYEREAGRSRIAVMIDAAQAPLWLPCSVPRLGADYVTFDGGKCGGLSGTGALVCGPGQDHKITSLYGGGGQEQGRRPGTENVLGAAAFATALQRAQASWEHRARDTAKIRDVMITTITARVPEVVVNGPLPEHRVANNINISLPGFDSEYAMIVLDDAGIAVGTKSACAGAGSGESVVVRTLTGDPKRARSTLRITLGPRSTVAEGKRVAAVLRQFCDRMKTLTKN